MLLMEFRHLWSIYEYEIGQQLIKNNNQTKNENEIYESKEFRDFVKDKLLWVGFSKDEIDSIFKKDVSKKILYKIIAYLISRLENAYSTMDELKKIIENSYILNIDNYTDDDLDKILLENDKLNY